MGGSHGYISTEYGPPVLGNPGFIFGKFMGISIPVTGRGIGRMGTFVGYDGTAKWRGGIRTLGKEARNREIQGTKVVQIDPGGFGAAIRCY
jgi:hypothetical protein